MCPGGSIALVLLLKEREFLESLLHAAPRLEGSSLSKSVLGANVEQEVEAEPCSQWLMRTRCVCASVCVCVFARLLTPISDVVEVSEHLLLVPAQWAWLSGRREHRCLRRELVIEVAHVAGAVDRRHERRLHFLRQEPIPVDVLQE